MHTPWLQIAKEVRKVNAPQLAGELDVSVGEAYLMLSDFLDWALSRCPEDKPPSASALIQGASAGRQIANAMGWRGDVKQLVAALDGLPYAMVEILTVGIRVRGLDRYDRYWKNAYPKLAEAWAKANPGAASARSRTRNKHESGTPDPDPDPDPNTDADFSPPNPPRNSEDSSPGEKIDWGPVADELLAWMVARRDVERLKHPGWKPTRGADRKNARAWALAWLTKHQPDADQLALMRDVVAEWLSSDEWARSEGASLSLWCSEGVWLPRWSDARVANGQAVRPPRRVDVESTAGPPA